MSNSVLEKAERAGALTKQFQRHSPIHQFSKNAKQFTILFEPYPGTPNVMAWTLIDHTGAHRAYGCSVTEEGHTAYSIAGAVQSSISYETRTPLP